MTSDLPSGWLLVLVVVAMYALGAVIGHRGKSTSWRFPVALGAALFAAGEVAVLALYRTHKLNLTDALYVGAGLAALGALFLGFAVQRAVRDNAAIARENAKTLLGPVGPWGNSR